MTGAGEDPSEHRGTGNPLTDERAMFSVLLRVMAIAATVIALAALVSPTAGAIAGLVLVGLWAGLVLSRRGGGTHTSDRAEHGD